MQHPVLPAGLVVGQELLDAFDLARQLRVASDKLLQMVVGPLVDVMADPYRPHEVSGRFRVPPQPLQREAEVLVGIVRLGLSRMASSQ